MGREARDLESNNATAATSYTGERNSSGTQAQGLTGNGAGYTQATSGSRTKDLVGDVTGRGQTSGAGTTGTTGTTGTGTMGTGTSGTHSGTGYTR